MHTYLRTSVLWLFVEAPVPVSGLLPTSVVGWPLQLVLPMCTSTKSVSDVGQLDTYWLIYYVLYYVVCIHYKYVCMHIVCEYMLWFQYKII